MKDERILEIVLPECDESYYKYTEGIREFERCTCGSSIVRIIRESIIRNKKEMGQEFSILCAKCGCQVFGFTDMFFENKDGAK